VINYWKQNNEVPKLALLSTLVRQFFCCQSSRNKSTSI